MQQPKSHTDAHTWEADVVMADGSIAVLRPTQPSDRQGFIDFYARVSDKSKYLRFFSAHPTLSDQDLDSWLDIDHYNQVTLVICSHDQIVATAHYRVLDAFLPNRVADVSFLVQDDYQGKGAANILLEHLAEVGRENQVERFFAEMLTQNRAMVQVFIRAGYEVKPQLEDGFISVDFPIDPTELSFDVMQQRERKSEAASIRRLLRPESIAVVGDLSRMRAIIPQLVDAPFNGNLHILTAPATQPGGAADDLRAISGDIDLVVAQYDAEELEPLLTAAAEKNARGMLVLARGHNPALTHDEQVHFVAEARAHGLRALGPAALGLINSDPEIRLNASPAPNPAHGSTGIFTQSAGVATLVLSHAIKRGCGISSFVATGAFADVTANDVIQYWIDDDATNVCLLSLDAIGNPRKFFRVLRRLALEKHSIIFTPSRALHSARHTADQHISSTHEDPRPEAPPAALDELIRRTGAIVVSRRDAMFDIAQILARQPLPQGINVTVISNSAGLSEQMSQAAIRFGLNPKAVTVTDNPVPGLLEATQDALEDRHSHAVVTAAVEIGDPILDEVHGCLSRLAATTETKPIVGVFVGFRDVATTNESEHQGQLPTFDAYADALEALAAIVQNQQLRAATQPADIVEEQPATGDKQQVQQTLNTILHDAPAGRWATDEETQTILGAYGIELVPWREVSSLQEAEQAAESFGWNVVLKATADPVRGRPELSTIYRNISTAQELTNAWRLLGETAKELGLSETPNAEALRPVVQPTVTAGVSLSMKALEDVVLGPMVSVGVSGVSSDLLADRTWRTAPIRNAEAVAMLEQLHAAPLLHGYRGTRPARLDSVQDLLVKLAQLKDDFASVVEVELTPVIAAATATHVVGARLRIAALPRHRDPLARSV